MPQAMDALLDNDGADRPSYSSLAQTLSGLEPSRARALVDEILGLSGIQPVGGRGVDEIVDRLMAKAADQSGPIIGKTAAQIIRRYLALAGSLDDVMPALETLALPLNLDLGPFKKRVDLISARGISRDQISFAAHFSRSIDYYTGVVFEIGEPGDPATGPGPLAAGGRYDGLLARLGADYDMPAIGFALWPERILAAAPEGPQS
jgi:ATP phosphoribosyltransferase regulatory subunit